MAFNIPMQQLRGTKANLESVNPILLEGQLVMELDTGNMKVGPAGDAEYNSIDYLIPNMSVESISGLLTIGTGVPVKVLGYHTKGDGGGGTFLWDVSVNKNLHNGGTVIDPDVVFPTDWDVESEKTTWFTPGTGAGCWVRLNEKSVNIACFGAKGDANSDGSTGTDDTQSIQAAVRIRGVLTFGIQKTYLCTSYIDINVTPSTKVSAPIEIDLNTSKVRFNQTLQYPAFQVRSDNVTIRNGFIDVVGTTMGGFGGSLACIYTGDQGTGDGWQNQRFSELKLSTNRDDAGGHIVIVGDSRDIIIENIEIPDNAVCRNIFGIEWGGLAVLNSTGHPHNITIRNVNIGKITTPTYGASGYAYAVWVSACFNISIENLHMEEGFGLLMAIRGDNSNTYARNEYKDLIGTGISIKNSSISNCYGYGINMIGSMGSVVLDEIPMQTLVDNVTLIGKKVGANNNFGIQSQQTRGVTVNNFFVSGFTAGFATSAYNEHLTVTNGIIENSELYGLSLSTVGGSNFLVDNIRFRGSNSLAGASAGVAALAVTNANDVRISNCTFGELGETETQKYSIYLANTDVTNVLLNNNITNALAATGVAYQIGSSSADTTINAKGTNNTSTVGLTNHAGAPIFQEMPDGTRFFTAATTPSVGTYKVGDKVYYTTPVSQGAIGAVCLTAGTPGTWAPFGLQASDYVNTFANQSVSGDKSFVDDIVMTGIVRKGTVNSSLQLTGGNSSLSSAGAFVLLHGSGYVANDYLWVTSVPVGKAFAFHNGTIHAPSASYVDGNSLLNTTAMDSRYAKPVMTTFQVGNMIFSGGNEINSTTGFFINYTDSADINMCFGGGDVVHNYYTRLGEAAPNIMMKELSTGTLSATVGSITTVAHGLTGDKIIGVQTIVRNATNTGILPGSTLPNSNYEVTYDATNVYIDPAVDATALVSKPFCILITYKE